MNYLLSIIGIIASLFMIKYRQQVGDTLGEADWMRRVGGIYGVVTLVAIFIFFLSIAELTGTTMFFLSPLRFLIPTF